MQIRRQGGKQGAEVHAFQQALPVGIDRHRRIARIGREQDRDRVLAGLSDDLGAQQFALPVSREAHRHQLAPDQRVGWLPGLEIEAGQVEFRRKGALAGLQPLVHPGGVGFERLQLIGRKVFHAVLRPPIEAEGTEQPVGPEAGRADDFRQPPLPGAPLHFHLEQPVLGMDITEGEPGVGFGLSIDVRDAALVPHDIDRPFQAGDGHGAVQPGQRGAEPEEHDDTGDRQHQDQRCRDPQRPAKYFPDHPGTSLNSARSRAPCSSSRGAGGRVVRSA